MNHVRQNVVNPALQAKPPRGFVKVYWICHGLEPFETLEALTLERLRRMQLVVPKAGVFDVTFAQKVGNTLVARCWPAKQSN